MTTKITTPPATEPIALSDAKNYLRIDYSADDTLVNACIARARRKCEDITGLRMYTQVNTSVVETEMYPFGIFSGIIYDRVNQRYNVPIRLYLPYSPVTAVTAISYESDFNVWASTDVSNFTIDYDSFPCTFVLNRDVDLSAVRTENRTYRFKVVYTVGYTTLSDISPTIMQAMYMLLGEFYTNRNNTPICEAAYQLLYSERIALL